MLTFSLLWSLEIRRRNDHIITAVPKGNSSESYKICFSFWIFLHSGHELKFRPGSRQALQNRLLQADAPPLHQLLSSVRLYHHRLKRPCSSSGGELRPAEGRGPVFADKQSQMAVFVAAAVGEVLTLNDLLHDVVGVDASVVHTAALILHGVLLPPGGPVREQGCRGGGRRPLRPGGRGLTERIGGSGGRRLRGVSDAAGGAAAGRGVPVVAEVGQIGRAHV